MVIMLNFVIVFRKSIALNEQKCGMLITNHWRTHLYRGNSVVTTIGSWLIPKNTYETRYMYMTMGSWLILKKTYETRYMHMTQKA